MLFEPRKFALCLAIVSSIGQSGAQNEPVPIIGRTTGIDKTSGERPLRININVMETKGGPMWDLYIRALDSLQNKPEGNERSHFAMAGIHGMPYTPYNGVGPVPQPRPGDSWGGYCPHGSPQLISWHRTHLLLYEQALGDEMQRLALEYSAHDDASAYIEASEKFRLPFWDWATEPTLPPCTTKESIKVNGPNGELVLHNPLYSYHWQTYPLNATQFPGQDGIGPATTRDGANGFDPNSVNENLISATDMIRDSVYRTFASSTIYDQMASMAGLGSNFEAPHNVIHNCVGGSFLNLDLTAFDSLFMLHHCNLDRLAAIWTFIHTNQSVQVQPFTSQGMYSTAEGEIVTADSPLKPFYQADGKTFHTGRTVATPESLGYTYPDISGLDKGRRERTITQVNKWFGGEAAPSTSKRGWFISVQVDRADVPRPCSIEVYLGDRIAGRTVLLQMPATGQAYDELPLTRAAKHIDVDGNDDRALESRIVSDLTVRVTKGDGSTLDPKSIKSLTIKVMGEDITTSGEGELPSYTNRTTLKTILEPPSLV